MIFVSGFYARKNSKLLLKVAFVKAFDKDCFWCVESNGHIIYNILLLR